MSVETQNHNSGLPVTEIAPQFYPGVDTDPIVISPNSPFKHEQIDSDERFGPVYEAEGGHANTMGVTVENGGCNVAFWASSADLVDVCIFNPDDINEPLGRVRLTGKTEGKDGVFHGFIPGMGPGAIYGYRVHGPDTRKHNYNKLLVDPYARAITGDYVGVNADGTPNQDVREFVDRYGNFQGINTADSAGSVPRSVVVDERYDWGEDKLPKTPMAESVVYEAHVKGLTMLHPDIPEHLRGTYAGIAHEKFIAHLVDLGVTTIELLPPQHFVSEDHVQQNGLTNYWGYNTLGFFAPHAAYSSSGERGQQVSEFKDMVKALHAAGIEVVIDVVYNHTPEGNEHGPTLSLKGIDKDEYYHLGGDGRDTNYSGCGNTLKLADSRSNKGLELVLDSMRYWATEMHVDGFRFDLATILSREEYAAVNMDGMFISAVENDPVLSQLKLIPEPWDPAPEHRLGEYSQLWSPWNDLFRNNIRDWTRGEGNIGAVATQMAGSFISGLPVNFLTAHDGFTLADLVSYNQKHNDANLEGNKDGESNNRSWNHGVEGPTDDEWIIEQRLRDARNKMLTMLMAGGVPMIAHGDEFLHTQRGNNNVYCQDNEIAWVDWNIDEIQREFLNFTRAAIQLRRRQPVYCRISHGNALPLLGQGTEASLKWFKGDGEPFHDGEDAWESHKVLGMYLSGIAIEETMKEGDSFLWVTNGSHYTQRVSLPKHRPYAGNYEFMFDTVTGTYYKEGEGPVINSGEFILGSLSSVLLRRTSCHL